MNKKSKANLVFGFSLLELMVAIGVGTTAMFIFISAINIQTKRAANTKVTTYLTAIVAQTMSQATNPNSIQNSLADPANTLLNACVKKLPACVPHPTAPVPFELYGANIGNAKIIAGAGPSNPILYTSEGNICPVQVPSNTCVYEAFASFRVF